ncbi:MAG: tRNA (N6-isopentenyl adenosine(37)-C2)-methylthiotransferase MiaB [Nitrospirae bacterium]|nr:tRNA (N6-isopentenyl adenosine(37)-C2)-methylthiotransferase MiaB [Nitrospirota bacterium]
MVFLWMPGKRFYIETFGCQMNVHDSEKISGVLSREGYRAADSAGESDLIVFNTCSIRHKAEQKFFSRLGRIRKLKKKNPNLRIAVAGCIAQQQGEKVLKRAPYVDFVFGPQNIHLLADLVRRSAPTVADGDNPGLAEKDLPAIRASGSRAWVAVMYGCNNFCSYCVVPYTRGRERSRPSANILREIEELAERGFREVTLLGQNVNSYRSEIGFPELLEKINSVAGIERIRFVTSHPRDLSERLISAIGELEKVCEHFHLPLQSGSTRILESMNRGYSYDEYRRRIDRLRSKVPGISLTTDIITGFPGETDADHQQTISALADVEFDGIFAFKFSPRTGTAAAVMNPQVMDEIKSRRILEILEVQDEITLKLNKKLEGSVQKVLVEGLSETDNKVLSGRTRSNKIVNFVGNAFCIGSTVPVRIVRARKHSLDGEPL